MGDLSERVEARITYLAWVKFICIPKFISGLCLLLVIVVCGCGTASKIVTVKNSWVLELKKGGCLDNCKSCNIVINQDGTYHYKGIYNVKKLGEKSGKFTAQTMAVIDGLVARPDWSSFRLEYGNQAEDSQRKEITISKDTLKKTIVYFRFEPQEIREIESVIDNLIQSDEF